MKKQLLVLFLAAAGTITACKKDDGPKTPKVKLLAKVTEVQGDETTVSTLSYDGSNRLASIKSDNKDTVNFSYDNKSNLSKLVAISDKDKSVIEITYAASGAPQSATIKSYVDGEAEGQMDLSYKVEDNKVTEITYKVAAVEVGKSKITYQNGNVTKIENSLSAADLEGIIDLDGNVVYTYGTKKNPLAGASLKYVLDPAISVSFFAKNEILTEKYGNEDAITYTYTYDADGYPLTQKQGTGEDAVTIKYEYK